MTALVRIKNVMESKMSTFEEALPLSAEGHVNPKAIVFSALSTIADSPQLQQCTTGSIAQTVLRATECGLRFGELAYMVPFRSTAKMIISYKGLIHLAQRHGLIKHATTAPYYKNEVEQGKLKIFRGGNPDVQHEIIAIDAERGPLAGVYCVATLPDGMKHVEPMTVVDLEKFRSKIKSGNSPVWRNHTLAMYRKTCVRQAANYWPTSPDFEQALKTDDAATYGEFGTSVPVSSKDIRAPFLKQSVSTPIDDLPPGNGV